MPRPKTHRVTNRTNLHTLCPVGAVIQATLKPLTPADFDSDGETNIDDDSILARVAGSIRGRVGCHEMADDLFGLSVSPQGDPNYGDGAAYPEIYADEISSIQILELPKPPQEATFGTARLRYDGGRLSCNGTSVDPDLVAAVAAARGWAYKGAPDPDGVVWGNTELTHRGLRSGCVTIPLDQLDDALDWCADVLGWCAAS